MSEMLCSMWNTIYSYAIMDRNMRKAAGIVPLVMLWDTLYFNKEDLLYILNKDCIDLWSSTLFFLSYT